MLSGHLAQPHGNLQDGAALAVRNVTSMSVITYATSTVATLGPVAMATNEIMRQIYILCLQSFTALDIATQALVATYLGKVGSGSVQGSVHRFRSLRGAYLCACVAAICEAMQPSLPAHRAIAGASHLPRYLWGLLVQCRQLVSLHLLQAVLCIVLCHHEASSGLYAG